jgi:hypothetical protein
MLNAGVMVFAPIAHSHPLTAHGSPGSWDFWQAYDVQFLDFCEGIIVLRLDGWNESVGVKCEIEHMRKASKPVYFVDEGGVIPRELEVMLSGREAAR